MLLAKQSFSFFSHPFPYQSRRRGKEGAQTLAACRGGRNRERRRKGASSFFFLELLFYPGKDLILFPYWEDWLSFSALPFFPSPRPSASTRSALLWRQSLPACLVACSSSAPHERSTPHLQVQLVFPPIFLLPRLVTSAPPPWLHAAAAAGADEFLISCSRMKNTLNSGSLAVLGSPGCSCFLGLAELVGCCCFFSLNLEEKIELWFYFSWIRMIRWSFLVLALSFLVESKAPKEKRCSFFYIEETCVHQSSSLSCSTNYYWYSRTTYPIRLNSLFLASSFPTGNPLVSLGILANNLNLLVLSSWIYDWILQVFLVPLWMFAWMKAKLLKLCSLYS